uniref:NAD(P)H-quinone oxidoreductase subunit 3 n=1 Tax=Pedicularis longiflora TaxID=326831 RepID=A0A6G7SDG3_9LAMI|nr:NADH-plastoquinone oxidoreductase subunit K [Pedicularis longiflora]QIJ99831.1 NADH-plastoquinone oxidoreductase subunit K [Pedicularis longiflora]
MKIELGLNKQIGVLRPITSFALGAPIRKGPEKLSSYESGIEPMGDAWLQFRIRYYMFALVFVVFDVETIFLYPWAMSFDVLGVSVFTGGMFSTDSYSTVRGVDKLIPVDVYLPSFPPKPEAVIDAITKLRKKISREIYEDRIRSQQANRCFTTNHKFRTGRSMNNGNYDQRFLYQPPSTSEIHTETFFKYQSSVSSLELVN